MLLDEAANATAAAAAAAAATEVATEPQLDPIYAQFRDQSRFWIQRVAVPCLMVVGLFGNLVTIIIMTRRRMRSTTNMYLAALAFVDMLYLVLTFLLGLSHYPNMKARRYYLYWQLRPFLMMLTDACSNTSVWLTVAFTIERFVAVKYPIKGKLWCTERRAKKLILSVFLFAILFAAPVPFEWKVIEKQLVVAGNSSSKVVGGPELVASPEDAKGSTMLAVKRNLSDDNLTELKLTGSISNFAPDNREVKVSSGTRPVYASAESTMMIDSGHAAAVVEDNGGSAGDDDDLNEEDLWADLKAEKSGALVGPQVKLLEDDNSSKVDNAEVEYTLSLENSDFGQNETYKTIYYWSTAVIFYFIPLLSLTFFNGFLIHSVHSSRRKRNLMTHGQGQQATVSSLTRVSSSQRLVGVGNSDNEHVAATTTIIESPSSSTNIRINNANEAQSQPGQHKPQQLQHEQTEERNFSNVNNCNQKRAQDCKSGAQLDLQSNIHVNNNNIDNDNDITSPDTLQQTKRQFTAITNNSSSGGGIPEVRNSIIKSRDGSTKSSETVLFRVTFGQTLDLAAADTDSHLSASCSYTEEPKSDNLSLDAASKKNCDPDDLKNRMLIDDETKKSCGKEQDTGLYTSDQSHQIKNVFRISDSGTACSSEDDDDDDDNVTSDDSSEASSDAKRRRRNSRKESIANAVAACTNVICQSSQLFDNNTTGSTKITDGHRATNRLDASGDNNKLALNSLEILQQSPLAPESRDALQGGNNIEATPTSPLAAYEGAARDKSKLHQIDSHALGAPVAAASRKGGMSNDSIHSASTYNSGSNYNYSNYNNHNDSGNNNKSCTTIQLQTGGPLVPAASASSQERRITIMLIAVVILFLFCQIPSAGMLIYTAVHETVPNTNEHALLLAFGNIFNFLMAVNAAGNFILYSFLSKKYRRTFVILFCGCLERRRQKKRGPRMLPLDRHSASNNSCGTSQFSTRQLSSYQSTTASASASAAGASTTIMTTTNNTESSCPLDESKLTKAQYPRLGRLWSSVRFTREKSTRDSVASDTSRHGLQQSKQHLGNGRPKSCAKHKTSDTLV